MADYEIYIFLICFGAILSLPHVISATAVQLHKYVSGDASSMKTDTKTCVGLANK